MINNIERFVGGQFEISNPRAEFITRGEIETIRLDGDIIKYNLRWEAFGVGYPSKIEKWVEMKFPKPKEMEVHLRQGYAVIKDEEDSLFLRDKACGDLLKFESKYKSGLLEKARLESF